MDASKSFSPIAPLIIIVGGYGSGKTEISINLAIHLSKQFKDISIADLDIVNPYFRCRQSQEQMQRHGIRVVIPEGAHQFADLPIIVPQIKGMLRPEEGALSIFDMGGDAVGSRLLSSFATALGDKPYSMLQVINTSRPFESTPAGCEKMMANIQASTRIKVTGFIVNTHLIDETTPENVLQGYHIAQEVSQHTGLPLAFVAAMNDIAVDPAIQALPVPILPMKRSLMPPWLHPAKKKDSPEDEKGSPNPSGRHPFLRS
jgi:hypothetical protein